MHRIKPSIPGMFLIQRCLQDPGLNSGWIEEEGGWRSYLGDTGQPIRNDWILDQDRKMATKQVTLTPDQDGALQYPGLAE